MVSQGQSMKMSLILSGETQSALGSADREGCGQDSRVLRGPRLRQGHRGARHAHRRALRERSSAGNFTDISKLSRRDVTGNNARLLELENL